MTDSAFADAIVRARTRNGLTQAELAEELGVSRSLVTAWETGRSEPSEELLAEMKAILGRIRREYGPDGQGSRRPAPTFQPRRSGRAPQGATTPQPKQTTTPAITRGARPSQMHLPVTTTPGEVPEAAPPTTRNGRAARTTNAGTDIYEIAAHLWDAADELRANSHLKAAEYSIPVLGLIFLKFADNRFAEAHAVLAPKATERNPLTKEKYQGQGVLYLPDEARFDRLLHLPGGENRGRAINDAMAAIEEENPQLRGVLPRTYQELSDDTIDRLLRSVNSMLTNIPGDAFGKVYEFFLGKFAIAEGAKGGEYFTPTPIVRLIVEIIEPFTGRILDPACGSGGMFVQSARFVDQHRNGKTGRLSIHGQEKTGETVKLAKMNLAVHGLEGDIRQSNTYYEDPFDCVGKFDYVMANPPFNVDKIDKDKLEGDRRFPFGLPRADNGNYIWIQAFYSALNDRGRAGFVMANSAADAGSSELEIRRKLIEDRCVDVIVAVGSNFFYTVTLPVTLWILDRSKRGTDREDKILFIDARKIFRQIDRAHRDWTPDQIEFLANVARLYRGELAESREGSEALMVQHFHDGAYQDVPGLCAVTSIEQIEEQGWSLNPGRYVGVAAAGDDGVDFKVRLRELNGELTRLHSEAAVLQQRIATNMTELLG
ncbi:MAG: N-6 DNA methylase [Candidatus Dormibacteria bacterium]|jgi:type I restriction enzyme M protein